MTQEDCPGAAACPLAYVPVAYGLVGGLAGLGVGVFPPRLLIHAETIECGASPGSGDVGDLSPGSG